MKILILLLSMNFIVSCSSLESDDLMTELRGSESADQARMAQLGYSDDASAELELIDPKDRYLLQEDFDCKTTKIAMAYCNN